MKIAGSKFLCRANFDLFLMMGLGMAGLWLVASSLVRHDLVPGDMGDGRFNNYILEHFFCWVTGKTPSFWNPGFYYPYPLVLAFSDNMLGSGPVYAFFRGMGLDRETAFQAWYITGYLLNYAACLYTFDRLRIKPAAAAFGAFIFSFGLPVMAQQVHVQLLYRFGIPLSILAFFRFVQTPRMSFLFQTVFWQVWQFYSSIYTGYFLMFFLAACMIVLAVRGKKTDSAAWLIYWPLRIRAAWQAEFGVSRYGYSIGTAALIFAWPG